MLPAASSVACYVAAGRCGVRLRRLCRPLHQRRILPRDGLAHLPVWYRLGPLWHTRTAVQCSSECGRSAAGFPLGSLCRAGPNGIGKSTLLNVIKGLMPPRFGMVTINPKLRLGSFAQVRVSLTARVSIPCGTVSHTVWSLRRHARDEPTCRTCSFYMLFRMLNVVPLR